MNVIRLRSALNRHLTACRFAVVGGRRDGCLADLFGGELAVTDRHNGAVRAAPRNGLIGVGRADRLRQLQCVVNLNRFGAVIELDFADGVAARIAVSSVIVI